MKFMLKMMLVPAGRVPLEISTMSDLDKAMTNVINNKNLTSHEKISLYSRILKKNLTIEENLQGKNSINEILNDNQVKKAEIAEPKIEPTTEIKKDVEEDEDIDLSELFKMEPEIDVKKEIKKKKKKRDDDEIINLRRLFKVEKKKKVLKKNVIKTKPLVNTESIESTLKTPKRIIPWESIPPIRSLRNKPISYLHRYPEDTFTEVGYKSNLIIK